MFDLPLVTWSEHARAGFPQLFSEGIATFGLLGVVIAVGRSRAGVTVRGCCIHRRCVLVHSVDVVCKPGRRDRARVQQHVRRHSADRCRRLCRRPACRRCSRQRVLHVARSTRETADRPRSQRVGPPSTNSYDRSNREMSSELLGDIAVPFVEQYRTSGSNRLGLRANEPPTRASTKSRTAAWTRRLGARLPVGRFVALQEAALRDRLAGSRPILERNRDRLVVARPARRAGEHEHVRDDGERACAVVPSMAANSRVKLPVGVALPPALYWHAPPPPA